MQTSIELPSSNGHLPRRPLQTVVGAGRALSGRGSRKQIARAGAGVKWQDEGWDLYDLVGELRFAANTLGGSMSRATLFVGRLEDDRDEPEPVDEGPAAELFKQLAGGKLGLAQVIGRMAVHLFVPGDSMLVGLPPDLLADGDDGEASPERVGPEGGPRLSDLSWHALSPSEVSIAQGRVTLTLGDEKRILREDDCWLIRVWRPHPRRWWEADSPVRANLPVLRELVGLTKHVAATIDSRLAGAGILFVPQSVQLAAPVQDPAEGDDATEDPFVAALTEAMLTPIRDRDDASAVVPIVAKVPDETVGKAQHMTFSTPFDAASKDLRDEAIRRLALGLDMPAETLLGMSQANHWSAWAIEESNIKVHVEPVLSLICDAFTTQYLWPVLEEAGVDDPESYVVWWDTSDLVLRPDRSNEAKDLHSVGAINDDALRHASGFTDTDAASGDQATRMALLMVQEHPTLMQTPGLQTLIDQLRAALEGRPVEPVEVEAPEQRERVPSVEEDEPTADDTRGTPDTQGDPPDVAVAASARRPASRLPVGSSDA